MTDNQEAIVKGKVAELLKKYVCEVIAHWFKSDMKIDETTNQIHNLYLPLIVEDLKPPKQVNILIVKGTEHPEEFNPDLKPPAQPENKDLREAIARVIWMDDTDSDIGWDTSHEFAHKTGHSYNIADQILSLITQPELKGQGEGAL